MVERDSRPYYGPWRIYTKEEEDRMIMDSLARENDFNRRWWKRKEENNGRQD